jgi:arylsulfatase A-like enzyme
VSGEPVSTLDLGPTFLDLAGATPLQTQHGQSLRPQLEGDGTRDFAMNEWQLLPTRTGVSLSLRTVRTRNHKLTVELISGAGELYDLENDPQEMENLFDAPCAHGIRAQLEDYLQRRPDDIGPDREQVGMA